MKHISKSKGQIILSHTFTYFNFLNLALAALIVISGSYKNMLFMGIIVTNSLIGIIQELKVKKLIDALSVITATKARRMLNGVTEEIGVDDIAVGDVLAVQIGDQIVADATVLTTSGLEVNESLLTGESKAVLKKIGDPLFSGSHIVAGCGTSQVIHTGEDNYATQLVTKAKKKRRATSEMQDAIKRIIRYVSFAIVPLGTLLYIIQRNSQHLSNSKALVGTVAGAIGMIPEGLVLLTSISFILGVGRLAKKHALVQEMESIEALARVNVLCLDKTGTITTGNLKVTKIHCVQPHSAEEIVTLMDGLSFSFQENNATGKALCRYFHDTKPYEILDTIPFSSDRKYLGVTFDKVGSFILGAPEFLTTDADILATADTHAQEGCRVLFLGKVKELSCSRQELSAPEPYGLIIISDEIRPDAIDTFRFFKENDVAIKVISGDNPATVSNIALQAGLEGGEHYIDATTLPSDLSELAVSIEGYNIFGRVSPEQKQLLVRAFRKSGKIVGMVGDGVNDVLAIKDADCGIAMAAGSDAAKQSAHIVLLDSDFSTMTEIVKEGRTIISNIERVSALYLTKTIYSILLCLIFIGLGTGYPFIPIQLSLIGAAAIGIPSFLLTLEQNGHVTTGGFLRHVLRISLPCALLLVGSITLLAIIGPTLGLTPILISTLNLLIGGIISLFVVFLVCLPMTRRHLIMLVGLTLLFFCGFFFFPCFFGIQTTFLGLY